METKLYVSRYSNKDLARSNAVKIGISRGLPKFKMAFQLKGNIILLAPPRSIFNLYDKVAFKREYFKHLDSIGINRIKEMLTQYGYGTVEEMVLLCYEDITCTDPNKNWCHRTMFAEWWESKTGENVSEYPDSGNYESKHKHERKRKNFEDRELNLYQMELLF